MVGPMLNSCKDNLLQRQKISNRHKYYWRNRIILRVERGAALVEKYVLNFANKENYVLFCSKKIQVI